MDCRISPARCIGILAMSVALGSTAKGFKPRSTVGKPQHDAQRRTHEGALRSIEGSAQRSSIETGSVVAGARNLQVKGRLAFPPIGQAGSLLGVDSIYVEVRDDDTLGHSVLWSGYTDSNGAFDTGVRDIGDDDPQPDIYLYFETTSPNVTVETGDILHENYSWSTLETHFVEDFTGNFYDFGTLVPSDSGGESTVPALNAFDAISRAHRFVQLATSLDIPAVNVHWPSGADSYNDYDGNILLGANAYLTTVVLHQYAHHLERSVGMAVSANNDCSNDCQFCNHQSITGEDKWCPLTPAIARSEGFAMWFPVAAHRDFAARYRLDSGEPYMFSPVGEVEFIPPEIIPDDPADHMADLSELRAMCGADILDNADRIAQTFAALLEDLSDDHMDDHAGDGISECAAMGDFSVLEAYLLNHPINALGMIDQLIANNSSDLPELYSVAANISPVFAARFPIDVEAPGIVVTVDSPSHPSPQGSALPCIEAEWGPPLDDVTGACGYSYGWTTSPNGTSVDTVEDIIGMCVSIGDGPFDVGDHYLSIRAKDCAGHWATQSRTFGPFQVGDCNNNGLVDLCDIHCSYSGYDGCDLGPGFCNHGACGLSHDCNFNLIPDECDLAGGASEDCNGNGVPDECEHNIGHWGPVTASWHLGGSWEEGAIPGPGNDICVEDRPGEITVLYQEGDTQIGSLSCGESLRIESRDYAAPWANLTINEGGFISGDLELRRTNWTDATLTLNADLQLQGDLLLNGGQLLGSGTLNANGGMTVARNSSVNLGTLELLGPTVSTDSILVGETAVIHNNAGQTWDHRGTGDAFVAATNGLFLNDGLFRKSTATGTSRIGCRIENPGEVRIESGKLTWWNRSVTSGSVVALPGTIFELFCGFHNFLPGSSITAERVQFDGPACGSASIGGSYNVSGATVMTSTYGVTFTDQAEIINYAPNFLMTNTVNFNAPVGHTIHFENFECGVANFNSGDPLDIVNLTLNTYGGITGTAPITVTGHFDWYVGTYIEGSGDININGTMTLHPGGSVRSLTHRVLNNAGVATIRSAFLLNYDDSAFNNLPGAVFDMQVDGNLVWGSRFNNAGTIVKSAGAGKSQFGCVVTNTGRVEVQTGTIEFYTDYGFHYEQTAGETVLNGGNINMFGSAPFRIDGGMLTGYGDITGTVAIHAGTVAPGLPLGTLRVNGPYSQHPGSVLAVDIGGKDIGEHDELRVLGSASLAGELDVTLVDGFALQEGDFVTVLRASSISGTFDTFVAPPELEVVYLPTEVRVGYFSSGDLDHDGDTDLRDVAIFQNCFGGSGHPPSAACPSGVDADLDSDGDVDAVDYAFAAPATNTGPR